MPVMKTSILSLGKILNTVDIKSQEGFLSQTVEIVIYNSIGWKHLAFIEMWIFLFFFTAIFRKLPSPLGHHVERCSGCHIVNLS